MKVRHIAALGATAAIATTGAVVVPGFAAGAASSSGKISFIIVEQGGGGKETQSAVLHGAITGAGKDTSKNNSDLDTLHLKGGTLDVKHPNKDAKFKFKADKKTCYYSFSGKGTYTLLKGTGKYKGVTGNGSYKIVGSGIAPKKKNGSCNFNSDGGPFVGYVTGSGPVSLP